MNKISKTIIVMHFKNFLQRKLNTKNFAAYS